jgi:hypothetical protein
VRAVPVAQKLSRRDERRRDQSCFEEEIIRTKGKPRKSALGTSNGKMVSVRRKLREKSGVMTMKSGVKTIVACSH